MQKWYIANKFNENSDLSMIYLGQTKMTRDTKIRAEERFPITGQGFASGKLLDWHRLSNLLDTSAMNPTCQSLIICNARLYMLYQNSHLTCREFKWEMDNM